MDVSQASHLAGRLRWRRALERRPYPCGQGSRRRAGGAMPWGLTRFDGHPPSGASNLSGTRLAAEIRLRRAVRGRGTDAPLLRRPSGRDRTSNDTRMRYWKPELSVSLMERLTRCP